MIAHIMCLCGPMCRARLPDGCLPGVATCCLQLGLLHGVAVARGCLQAEDCSSTTFTAFSV